MLFLEGANWKQLAIAVPNTSVTLTGSSNILLSYFIITALVFVVAVGQLCKLFYM